MRSPRKKEVSHIVVHCSATPEDRDIGVADIDTWHKAKGWDGCGYHLVIRRNGRLESGEPLANRGAHTYGHNETSIGICMVGGYTDGEPNFTEEQYSSLETAISFLDLMFPNAEVLGHRDLSPDVNGDGEITKDEWLKDCPTFDVREWLSSGKVVAIAVKSKEIPTKPSEEIVDKVNKAYEQVDPTNAKATRIKGYGRKHKR